MHLDLVVFLDGNISMGPWIIGCKDPITSVVTELKDEFHLWNCGSLVWFTKTTMLQHSGIITEELTDCIFASSNACPCVSLSSEPVSDALLLNNRL